MLLGVLRTVARTVRNVAGGDNNLIIRGSVVCYYLHVLGGRGREQETYNSTYFPRTFSFLSPLSQCRFLSHQSSVFLFAALHFCVPRDVCVEGCSLW